MPRLFASQDEIDQTLNRCSEAEEEGTSVYPGMTYEQGVQAAIEWLTGITNTHPFDNED